MRKVAVVLFVAVGVLGIGAVATADDDDGSGKNSARLNGYQEVASGGTAGSVSTRGFGSFHIEFNRNMTADYVLTYRDVETPVTQAHIHFAQRSVVGPVTVFLCRTTAPEPPPSPRQACPPTSGTVRGTITVADLVPQAPDRGIEPGMWDEFVAAVKVGHTYVNVHSTRFPGGEIRGQINDRDQKEYTGPPPFAFGGDNGDD
jgi:CHRD domain-containing protein